MGVVNGWKSKVNSRCFSMDENQFLDGGEGRPVRDVLGLLNLKLLPWRWGGLKVAEWDEKGTVTKKGPKKKKPDAGKRSYLETGGHGS